LALCLDLKLKPLFSFSLQLPSIKFPLSPKLLPLTFQSPPALIHSLVFTSLFEIQNPQLIPIISFLICEAYLQLTLQPFAALKFKGSSLSKHVPS